MTLQDLLNKTCLIGLTYLNAEGDTLKTTQHAGKIVAVDAEKGITIQLTLLGEANEAPTTFQLPPSLEPWFVAPKGHYKNEEHQIDIDNPNYFVTWDVVKNGMIPKKVSRNGGSGTREWCHLW